MLALVELAQFWMWLGVIEQYVGECIQAGRTGGATGQAVAANQTDNTRQNMAPSQELELNVQFNWCCVLSYVIEFSLSVTCVGQAACLFSRALWLCCPMWEVMRCYDVSDLVSFANLIPCLLLWLTQNELRRCKDSSQGAVKEELDCGVTSAETVYVELVFLCRGLAVGVHTNQHRSTYILTSALFFSIVPNSWY